MAGPITPTTADDLQKDYNPVLPLEIRYYIHYIEHVTCLEELLKD